MLGCSHPAVGKGANSAQLFVSIRINFVPSGQQTTCPTENSVKGSNSPTYVVQPQGSVNSSQGLYVESKDSLTPTPAFKSVQAPLTV